MTTSLTTVIGANVTDRPKPQAVEIDATGLTWLKSSASDSSSSGCVELARAGDRILVRCSRHGSGPRISLPTLASLIDWVCLTS